MNHPIVDQMERTGYPAYSPSREQYKVDPLGNEVYSGDDILVLNDEFFLVETMSAEAIEVLELLGASYEIAK